MSHLTLRLLGLLLLVAVGGVGCAQCRVPAIDPTGQRLFSGTTTITPVSDCPLIPKCPKAAWQTPPYPPLCGKGQPAIAAPVAPATVPVGFNDCPDAYAPNLTITPQRFVAPVGTDVVLVAGMCGQKGYYVMRQPLEWMVAPEGVGYIVEVGKENCPLHKLCSYSGTPKKVNTTYALAHTSSIRQTITRGTGRAEDDLELVKGQSWISVSSPNEGVSYVTVLAPAEQNWERRKQSATIYWVDAKWFFPQPAVVRPSERHRLTTKIVRSNGLPVAGWVVRYDILDGPPAAFGVANEQTIELQTDINGEANVELLPQSKDAGISQLRVQIIRPDAAQPGEPPMLVGQGFTQVQWSTPGLIVRGEATQRTGPDGTINYRIEVVNNGDQLTRDVALNFTPPQGVSVVGSNPQAQTFGQRLEWRLGNLTPGAAQVVNVAARATLPGDFQSCFSARSGDGIETPPTCFTTNVAGNALKIDVEQPPTTNVNVGDVVQYRVRLTNTSAGVITGIQVRDTFDAGLEHFDPATNQPSGVTSPINRPAANLQANESLQFTLTFRVNQPGQQCHTLNVAAENGQSFAQQYCLRAAVPAVPVVPEAPMGAGALRLRTTASLEQAREGEQVNFVVEATNSGTAPLTDVRIDMIPSQGLEAKEVYKEAQQTQVGFYWTIPRLDPGQTITRALTCVAQQAGVVGVKSEGTATGIQRQESDVTVRILPGTPNEPGPIPAGPNPPGGRLPMPVNPAAVESKPLGELRIALDRSPNPVPLGREVTFTVSVSNQGAGSDQNVSVRMKFPPGLSFVKVPEAPTGVSTTSDDLRTIELAPIQEVRAGERLSPAKFVVKSTAPGEYTVEVQVFSASHPEGITRDTTISVFARP